MGRRQRKVVRIPKKKLPRIFLCSKYRRKASRVEIITKKEKGIMKYDGCDLNREILSKLSFEEIYIYCKFINEFYT